MLSELWLHRLSLFAVMLFASPLSLLGILPWAGVVIYLIKLNRPQHAVPFLQLWNTVSASTKQRSRWNIPPLPIIWILTSALLCVLAAARPLGWRLPSSETITIILDRGITMSPDSVDGKPFRGVLNLAEQSLSESSADAVVELQLVPGARVTTNVRDWARLAKAFGPTAMDAHSELEQAVTYQLQHSAGRVIVLSDQEIELPSNRVIQIPPASEVHDIGIVDVAARSGAKSQLMVRIRNQSMTKATRISIASGEQKETHRITLPPSGGEDDYFFDLPNPEGQTLAVQIEDHGGAPVNDKAWLVREKSWPILEAMGPLPPSVGRMISVYSKLRDVSGDSERVRITSQSLGADERGVWIVARGGPADGAGTLDIVPHPVVEGVKDWPGTLDANVKPPAGFRPVVVRGGVPIVAIRDGLARQVWLSGDLDLWSRSPYFVLFFSNAFNWTGEASDDRFAKHQIAQLSDEWRAAPGLSLPAGVEAGLWPALYQRRDSALRAVNAPPVKWQRFPVIQGRDKRGSEAASAGRYPPTQGLFCVFALACVAFAALAWKTGSS